MSKRSYNLMHVLSMVSPLLGDIFRDLEALGSTNPEADIFTFLDGGDSRRLAEVIFGEMFVESWKAQVDNSLLLVEFVALKARRDLSIDEVQKIAKIRGLALGCLPWSRNFSAALEHLVAMFPKAKVTLIGMPVDERGSVPIVSGSTKNVIGWRKLDEGISKGEVIAAIRYLE